MGGDLAEHLVLHDPSFRRARLPALYSDFRGQRTLNPDGYTANLAAWRSGLARLAWDGRFSGLAFDSPPHVPLPKRLVLRVDENLPSQLSSKQFGRPLALGTVVRDALEAGELLPVYEFLSRKESIYSRDGASRWSSVPWNVASWAARQLGSWTMGSSHMAEDTLPKGEYVMMANVEKAATAMADRMAEHSARNRFERTFTRRHFEQVFFASGLVSVPGSKETQKLAGTDVDVLIRYLERDKGLVASDGKTIRIRTHAADQSGGGVEEEAGITEEDATVANLRQLVEDLKHQVELLADKVDETTAKAKAAVGRKNNHSALHLLRSKRTAEAMLRRRSEALIQMEDLAAKVQQARDQIQLVRIMEGSAAVLKQLNVEVGGVDKVEGVVDVLRDHMAETDEVSRILAGAGTVEVDEAEIDEELEAMERAEQQKVEEARRVEKEAEEARLAEETRRRLQDAGTVPVEPVATDAEPSRDRTSTPATETSERLRKMSLDERPQRELAN